MDGQACIPPFSGEADVYYGANRSYFTAKKTGEFTCLPGPLGLSDPVPNVRKTCFVRPSARNVSATPPTAKAGYRACAHDTQECTIIGLWSGKYGANGRFVNISGTGSFKCMPAALSVADPAPNIRKTCFVKDEIPDDYRECAKDGKKCNVSGKWLVKYGALGTYIRASGQGPFICSPKTFGVSDPVKDTAKTCFVKELPKEIIPPAEPGKNLPDKVSRLPAGYKACAWDNEYCKAHGGWAGYYGAQNSYVKIRGNGDIQCSPKALKVSDPVKGVRKQCFLPPYARSSHTKKPPIRFHDAVAKVPAGFTQCATDGKKCVAHGSWAGYYGAPGDYIEIRAAGTVICSPQAFSLSDPAPGKKKTCFVQTSALTAPPARPTTVVVPGLLANGPTTAHRVCATDGKTCKQSGKWTGFYGVEGKYLPIKGSGNFECSTKGLKVPDPAHGKRKSCSIIAVASLPPRPTVRVAGYGQYSNIRSMCRTKVDWEYGRKHRPCTTNIKAQGYRSCRRTESETKAANYRSCMQAHPMGACYLKQDERKDRDARSCGSNQTCLRSVAGRWYWGVWTCDGVGPPNYRDPWGHRGLPPYLL